MGNAGPDFLILGGSGYVGRPLFGRLGRQRSLATYHASSVPGGIRFDGRTSSLRALVSDLTTIRYGVILFAQPRVDRCAADPAGAAAINVEATRRVIDEMVELRIMPVFVSTDLVFDGLNGDYCEESIPRPVLTYGEQKLIIERYLHQIGIKHLVLRLAKVLSGNLNVGGLLTEWTEAISAGRPVYCADDQICSFIDVEDVVTAFVKLIECGASGLFHVGGPVGLSRFDLFEMLAGNLPPRLRSRIDLRRCSIDDVPGLLERRPRNTSLDSRKLYRAIDCVPRSMEEICRSATATL